MMSELPRVSSQLPPQNGAKQSLASLLPSMDFPEPEQEEDDGEENPFDDEM